MMSSTVKPETQELGRTEVSRSVTPGGVQPGIGARPLVHALLFVLGFSAIFVALGAVVSVIGQLVFSLREPLARIGGIVMILFGLATMGVLSALSRGLASLQPDDDKGPRWWEAPVRWLRAGMDGFMRYFYADTRPDWGQRGGSGYLSSFLMGTFFAAGWTPCIGPTLGAILTLGYSTATVGQGAFLLSGYSLGLAIPFLLFAVALDRATGLLRSLKRHMHTIQLVNGALLILIGIALLTNQLTVIARWAQQQNLYLDVGFLGGATPTLLVAMLAGLLSFLSPCVLPLVPAYIFYLSGRAVSQAAMG